MSCLRLTLDCHTLRWWFPMLSVFGGEMESFVGSDHLVDIRVCHPDSSTWLNHPYCCLTGCFCLRQSAPIWGCPLLNGASGPKMQVFPELSTFNDWSRRSSLPQVLIPVSTLIKDLRKTLIKLSVCCLLRLLQQST